jgi:hypothetical protein
MVASEFSPLRTVLISITFPGLTLHNGRFPIGLFTLFTFGYPPMSQGTQGRLQKASLDGSVLVMGTIGN